MRETVSSAVAAVILLAGCAGKTVTAVKLAEECRGPPWTCMESGPCTVADWGGKLCAVGMSTYLDEESARDGAFNDANGRMAAAIVTEVTFIIQDIRDTKKKPGRREEVAKQLDARKSIIAKRALRGCIHPVRWRSTWKDDPKNEARQSTSTSMTVASVGRDSSPPPESYSLAVLDFADFEAAIREELGARDLPSDQQELLREEFERVRTRWDKAGAVRRATAQ